MALQETAVETLYFNEKCRGRFKTPSYLHLLQWSPYSIAPMNRSLQVLHVLIMYSSMQYRHRYVVCPFFPILLRISDRPPQPGHSSGGLFT